MMRGDNEPDVLQIGFFWKIGFLNKTLVASVEADVLQGLFRTKKASRVEIETNLLPPRQCKAEALKNEGGKTKQITWREILGLEDLLSLTVWRASVAELLGTAVLVFALDTIVISTIQTGTSMPNLILSTLVAIIITILLLATFPISGGHINPLITFAAFLTGLISPSKTFIYILAQCVGAIFGALALKAVVNREIQQTFSLGGCTLTVVAPGPDGQSTVTGLETSQALWLEIICGFVFLFASVWMAFDHRQAKGLGRVSVFIIGGIVLGLQVFVSTTVTATKGYAGAGLNPARCLGPAIVRGGHLWNGHWVFWVGPATACVAFAVYTKIIPRELAHTIE
ncbi:aquaporin AQPAn.G-like [Populus alba x Populus x berolinensis]|nr:aquaporin AQPAn.G-like [Populus alba x Populus x berolinensis]